MNSLRHLVPALALGVMSASAFATSTVYTSSASFLTQVAPGYYTETFTGIPDLPGDTFSGGGFSYQITSAQGIYGINDFLTAGQVKDALTISFTGTSVYAVGGNFFASDINGAFQSAQISLLLSDGTSVNFTPTSQTDSFRGFVSNVAITSIVIGGAADKQYTSLDNLTVAAAVPEPASWALAALGMVGVAAAVRRRRT